MAIGQARLPKNILHQIRHYIVYVQGKNLGFKKIKFKGICLIFPDAGKNNFKLFTFFLQISLGTQYSHYSKHETVGREDLHFAQENYSNWAI